MNISPNSIRIISDDARKRHTYVPLLIIGAGVSGVAMGCRLKESLGFDQFRIYDRQAGVGGTWYSNRYPGVACDIPAVFYSFSFSPNNSWTSFHPSGAEIRQYIQDVCSKYQIVNNIQCNSDIVELKWLPDEELWEAKILHMVAGTGDMGRREREELIRDKGPGAVYTQEEIVRAKIVCSCAGGFVEPNPWPRNVSGRANFKGEVCHTARWNPDLNLHDKNVLVLGTGCSAAQVVPQLLKTPCQAKTVTQIMRSPPWVVPRPIPPIVGEQWWEQQSSRWFTRLPILARLFRLAIFLMQEKVFFDIFPQTPRASRKRVDREEWLLSHLQNTVPKEYQNMLKPNYSVGCKRQIYDAYWFPSLRNSRIKLTTRPLISVDEYSATLGSIQGNSEAIDADDESVSIPADVIILANGFEIQTWFAPIRIIGKSNQEIHKVWDSRGGPQAYLGIAHDGFPNFFTIFGPNTATGHSSVIMASENMINYSLKFIRPVLCGHVSTFEVKESAEVAWTSEVQQRLNSTVFNNGGCMSWYQSQETGWNATVYPYSQIDFWYRCKFPKWSDWDIQYTPKGRRQSLRRRILYVCAIFIMPMMYCLWRETMRMVWLSFQ